MKTSLATTALVLCTLGTATAQAAGIEFAPARLMFDPTPVAEWDQRPDSEAAPTTITLTQSRQWYWAHYRATHPLTTAVAQVQAYEQREAAPIGLVEPGLEVLQGLDALSNYWVIHASSPLWCDIPSKAVCFVIVDDADRLHPRVDDDGSHELETALPHGI
jgi:hypothetical protein